VLPTVMRRFQESWPEVDIDLRESHSDIELAASVERGALDLTFVQLPIDNPSLETVELLRDPYVLVVPAGSPLAARDRVPTLREVAEQPLIGFRACRSSEIVADQLRATGREPRFVFRSDDNGIVQGLASAGVGVAVVPLLTVDENDDTIATIPLGTRIAPRIVGITWHADRYHSAAARAFVETAKSVAAETVAALSQAA
jgi:DNA-binding transcriptional LysR family regulator